MSEMTAEKLLRKLGLSEKEAQVWLMSLKLGAQPASVIAKKVELKRVTVFVILSGLVEKGLATKSPKGGTTWFQVLGTEALVEFLEREEKEGRSKLKRQKRELEKNLDLLKREEGVKTVKPKIRFFEGKKGMREAFLETLKVEEDEAVRGIGNFDAANEMLKDVFPDYFDQKKKLRVKTKGIAPATPLALERVQKDEDEMRELKLVRDEKWQFRGHMELWDDKVLLLSYQDKMATLIENEEISGLMKNMFDMIWEKMK